MEQLPSVNLTFFLWLPAGKDEFGFGDLARAPLSDTVFYRRTDPLEETISNHFENRVGRLTSARNKFAFMAPASTYRPIDGELGLRKIHFDFSYDQNYSELSGYVREEAIRGTAIFYSNGLYLWSFRIPLEEEFTGARRARLKEVLKGFLEHDFVNRHLRHIFNFEWNPGQAEGDPARYPGILTYYQLDLLFNGVFDQDAHPHLSLGDGMQEGEAAQALERYGVEYLIQSLSMAAIDNDYFPLFDKRKSYSLRRTHGDDVPYISSAVSLAVPQLPPDADELHERELFIARISFAAMEQFLRVAISFGLTHYKTGLDHIRSELISQGMQARKNSTSNELRRPSLRNHSLTIADLETYYSLLVGKLPILGFLKDLIQGLSEVTAPAQEVEHNGVRGAVEYQFAKGTLNEAQTQFQRMVNAIAADIRAIGTAFESVRADQMILELTESRKFSEIAAESPRAEVEVAGGRLTLDADDRVKRLLVLIGVSIGLMEVFGNIGVTLMQLAYSGEWEPSTGLVIGYWIGLIVVVTLLFAVGYRLLGRPAKPGQNTNGTGKLETHVYDYSSLLREVKGSESAVLMDRLRQQMLDIEQPDADRRPAVSFSTAHETPSSGVERIKYSLESPKSDKKIAYILHVEFDRGLSGRRTERLLDIRLVVRKPVEVNVDVVPGSHRVIAECVRLLLFADGDENALRHFCRERFGWDPSPAQGAPRAV
ncbi:hypothetical protein GCM10009555_038590 [Acrocarpospora macrocephala]|uniref:Uncharacterized protein n=1 Tax=Acrocarpospora macrocephala TaxID=150177 RepID=A0A5M3WKI6_9ACTN|nr:hypothetical protein [Acrocarpospora macrocephala]GES09745.1 hypothetical protein Amac_033410 [Acrocarpospora macrocephala]